MTTKDWVPTPARARRLRRLRAGDPSQIGRYAPSGRGSVSHEERCTCGFVDSRRSPDGLRRSRVDARAAMTAVVLGRRAARRLVPGSASSSIVCATSRSARPFSPRAPSSTIVRKNSPATSCAKTRSRFRENVLWSTLGPVLSMSRNQRKRGREATVWEGSAARRRRRRRARTGAGTIPVFASQSLLPSINSLIGHGEPEFDF